MNTSRSLCRPAMSSAAGPMVPVRTGSWLLRPLASSLSSNAVSVLPVISAAAFGVWALPRARLASAAPRTRQSYMVRAPNQGAAYSPVGAGRACWERTPGVRVLLHHFDHIAGLGLTLGVQTVQQPQLFLLELLDRHVLGVVVDLRLLGGLDDFQPVGLGERIFRGPHVAHRLDARHEHPVVQRRAGLTREAGGGRPQTPRGRNTHPPRLP